MKILTEVKFVELPFLKYEKILRHIYALLSILLHSSAIYGTLLLVLSEFLSLCMNLKKDNSASIVLVPSPIFPRF